MKISKAFLGSLLGVLVNSLFVLFWTLPALALMNLILNNPVTTHFSLMVFFTLGWQISRVYTPLIKSAWQGSRNAQVKAR